MAKKTQTITEKDIGEIKILYVCPNCDEAGIEVVHLFCPTCGIKLKWADKAIPKDGEILELFLKGRRIKKPSRNIFQLKCEDHTNLGGRMGTETTRTLWTELFWKRDSAVKFAIDFCKRKKADAHIMKEVKKLKDLDNIDAYTWGFEITRENIRGFEITRENIK